MGVVPVPGTDYSPPRADRERTPSTLIYAIGCAVGRYASTDGLVLCRRQRRLRHDPYKTFPADADGIVPITGILVRDDAANRVREFLRAVGRRHTGREHGLARREPGHQAGNAG